MSSPGENVARLKDAYRQWHESKGGSVQTWLDLMADDVSVRSLANGGAGAEFTSEIRSKADFKRYFDGLLGEWEMINYKTGAFIADGDWVAMRGSTAWKNRATGRSTSASSSRRRCHCVSSGPPGTRGSSTDVAAAGVI